MHAAEGDMEAQVTRLQRVRNELAGLRVELAGYREELRLVLDDAAAQGDGDAAALTALTAERGRLYEQYQTLHAELVETLRLLRYPE
jgi:hypothetical protein